MQEAKKLRAEELERALDNVCGSPVYEDRKRARGALSDHIAAQERELEEARGEQERCTHSQVRFVDGFWRCMKCSALTSAEEKP